MASQTDRNTADAQATELAATRTRMNGLGPTWLAIASIAPADGGYMNGKTRPSLG